MKRKVEVSRDQERVINEEEDDVTSTQMMVEDARARRNLKTMENESRFQCEICEFNSGSKNLLNKHKKTHQSTKVNQAIWTEKEVLASTSQPETTGTRALPPPTMRKHVESVHEEIRYSCDQCETKFKQKDDLKTHIQSVHKENNAKDQGIWTEKEVSESSFQTETTRTRVLLPTTKVNKKKHVSTRLKCELCEEKFNKQETYSKHMLKIHKKNIELEGGDNNNKSSNSTNKVPPIFNLLTEMTLRSKAEKRLDTNIQSNAEESYIDKE